MNSYHLDVITDLKQRRDDAERNYQAARKEWEQERIKQRNLVNAGDYGQEFKDAATNIRLLFNYMQRLDEESMSMHDCIRAIEKHA